MIHIYINGKPIYQYSIDELEDIIAVATTTTVPNSILRKYLNTVLERRKKAKKEYEEYKVK